jgi:hypothetical protein
MRRFVARADHLAPSDASAAERQGPAGRPMVAAEIRVHEWRTAELSHCQYDRRFEHAALVKIIEQD